MDHRNATTEAGQSEAAEPERVTRLQAGNRSPGVGARLMFPGWGPKLWERPVEQQPDLREYRSRG